MSRTLAELRADKSPSLPTRVLTICLDQRLLAQVQRLEMEKQDLTVEEAARKGDPDNPRPQRIGVGPDPRLAEIDNEMAALFDEMREAEGELLLRATEGGVWQRWKDAHPAREGNQTDEQVAYGLCDATALLDSLATYVVSWDGDELTESDWVSVFAPRVAPADLSNIVTTVVSLHEARVAVPKSRPASSETPVSATS